MKISTLRHTILRSAAMLFVVGVAVSCSDDLTGDAFGNAESDRTTGYSQVELAVPRIGTRTEIVGDDGHAMTLEWSDGDRISLWAAGRTAFQHQIFTHKRYDFADPSHVMFKGYIPDPMAEDENGYTYCAFYPADKVQASGTEARLAIPAVQSGDYDPEMDVMYAVIERAERLTSLRYNKLDFEFKHLAHALKIRIPENPFGENPVTRMRIEFPHEVVGELMFGNVGEDLAPVLNNGSNIVLLEFAEPKQADDEIWVYIAGDVDMSDGTVLFTATDGRDYTYPSQSAGFRLLQAGHITPVSLGLRLREVCDEPFTITVSRANLGEYVDTLHAFTLPEGFCFPSLDGTRTATMDMLTPVGEGMFRIDIFKDIAERIAELEGTPIDMTIESEHTVARDWSSEATDVSESGMTVTSPWLFFEDFSGVESFSSDDSYTSGSNATGGSAYSFLSGWSGGRVGAQAGTSIRIACRRETSARYGARVDSAPVVNLKDGASVNVIVTFDYGMDRQEGGVGSGPKVNQTVYCGHVTDDTAYSGGSTNGTFDTNFTMNETGASWYNLPNTTNYTINECSNQTRMSWRTVIGSNAGFTNSTCWLYLDNIRVSIAAEE